MNQKKVKSRLAVIDFCRLFSVCCIFCFHSYMHMNIKFGILESFVSQGAVVMILFFMISGFSLQYVHDNDDYTDWNNIKKFYIRRFAGIYPLYLIVMLIDGLWFMQKNFKHFVVLLPVETLGLQGYFDTLYEFWNNGGTWFITCISLCYIAFPFVNFVFRNIGRNTKIIIGVLLYLVDAASPVIASIMGCSWVYPKPFFRLLQFILGMIVASLCFSYKNKTDKRVIYNESNKSRLNKKYIKIVIAGVVLLLFILIVSVLSGSGFGTFASYNFIATPIFIILLYLGRDLELKENIIINFLVRISFGIYLVQGYSFMIVNKIFDGLEFYCINIVKFVVSLAITIIIGAFAYFCIEKPAKRFLIVMR